MKSGIVTPLPPQTAKTIGDTLTAKNVSWAWYAGGWDDAVTGLSGGVPGVTAGPGSSDRNRR